ncbi:MAG TPA: APC family permease [Bacteroidales bacterium]|nr:APC family permease [Bacteroidales bacterium]
MKKLSLVEVISMAVGTMIGASIFSVFGLGAQVAGHDLPEAFLLSGVYALVVAYSYAILGSKIISNAGPIGFILKGLGDSVVTGALSILLWMSYVVSIALLVKGFAGYFLPLLHIDLTNINMAIVESITILLFVVLNFFGSKAVGKSEFFIVVTKLAILFIFIIGGLWTIQGVNIQPAFDYNHTSGLINASVIFFLSYMGFGLITNASENLKNPRKNVPRAIFISIFIVIAIYVLISLVTLGNLSLKEVVDAKENALAIAAKPFLGQFGFILISIGALFSISSALNASIFGGANIAYALAKDGELPTFFERKVWFKSTEGLYITAGLGLFFALTFNLGDIATITSSVFTVVYVFVVISHIRIRKDYGGKLILLIFNLIVLNAVFIALLLYQWKSHRNAFYGTIITFTGSLIVEYVFRLIRKRKFTEHHKPQFKVN